MIRTGLILLTVGWLVSAAGAQTATTPAPKNTASSKREFRQAYREGFQPPSDTSDEMKQMREWIQKINQTALPEYRPEPVAQPPRKASPQPAPVEAKKPEPVPNVPPAQDVLSTRTLRELARRVPESVADPIRLGDALYRSGHSDPAMFIYQNALTEAKDPEDQVWLYYQMGCCLKDTKPAEARTYFRKVHAVAPDGPWAELADIQLQLVDWMERNQPGQFLEDLHRDLQPRNERIEEARQARSRTGDDGQSAGSGTPGSANPAASATSGKPSNIATPAENASPTGRKALHTQ